MQFIVYKYIWLIQKFRTLKRSNKNQKRHGNIKLSIVRPSIVISSYKEPVVGWTETLSAMGGLLFAVLVGLINYLYCNPR